MPHRPLLLLSNDDGVYAKGLRFLIETLRPMYDLFVMAPDSPRSGAACSITSAAPLRYRVLKEEESLTLCCCNGTPADCVKLALCVAMGGRRPDLVIGGVNHGSNASVNAHYSGTMGVVFEATQQGLPAMALSLCDYRDEADFSPLKPYVERFTRRLLACPPKRGECLNVNFPLAPVFKGVRVCRMAHSLWEKEYEERRHPYGTRYFWLTGEQKDLEPEAEDTDLRALEQGFVAITPTTLDVTSYALMNRMKDWEE